MYMYARYKAERAKAERAKADAWFRRRHVVEDRRFRGWLMPHVHTLHQIIVRSGYVGWEAAAKLVCSIAAYLGILYRYGSAMRCEPRLSAVISESRS